MRSWLPYERLETGERQSTRLSFMLDADGRLVVTVDEDLHDLDTPPISCPGRSRGRSSAFSLAIHTPETSD